MPLGGCLSSCLCAVGQKKNLKPNHANATHAYEIPHLSGPLLVTCSSSVRRWSVGGGRLIFFTTGGHIVKLYWLWSMGEKPTNGDEVYVLLPFNFSNEYCDSEEAIFNYTRHCDFISLPLNVDLLLLRMWLDRDFHYGCAESSLSAGSWQISKEIPKIAPLLFIALADSFEVNVAFSPLWFLCDTKHFGLFKWWIDADLQHKTCTKLTLVDQQHSEDLKNVCWVDTNFRFSL